MRNYFFLSVLCFWSIGVCAQLPIDSDLTDSFDIESYLDSLASVKDKEGKPFVFVLPEVSEKKDSVAPILVATVVPDSFFVKKDTVVPKIENVRNPSPAPKKVVRDYSASALISKDDSLRLAKESVDESLVNPMFLDWVFTVEPPKFISERTEQDRIRNVRVSASRYIRENAPELIAFHEDELPDAEQFTLRLKQERRPVEDFLLRTTKLDVPKNIVVLKEQRKWKIDGKVSAQVSQNYISPNWYTGGTGNLSILSYVNVTANYDNKKNFQFDNSLEWKAGFNSTTSDSLRFLNTNEDILKITSKLGLKAFKSWYYTLSGEFSTQLFNTYITNTKELSTSLFSPIRLYVSLGLDYKYKSMLSLVLAPLSYKMTYVMNTSKAEGVSQSIAEKFAIPEGRKSLHTLGSRIQVDFKYSFTKELKLESKMYLYTDYKGIEFDMEVVGNYIATRFLTIQLSLHPRYDSNLVLAEGQKTRFQFREFTSLGFLYRF